ncbi:hypothetical protein BpHYR1_054054 [Brachionus plicatilis]|uniref:Uncharacterized protein n=1 Tax=Brachionus plicatilis TaxID=10195 RepID=A0A3M7RZX9_BRAPC|nr:hypothetical protein BpHYR1_054054 [Brachionus plicatilis]
MRLRPNILSVILICFKLLSRSFGETNLTDYKASDCNRRCTTGYSDAACWSRSFDFFIRDMMNSVNNYLGVAETLSNLNNETKIDFLNEIASFEKKIIDNLMEQLEEEADLDLKSITLDLRNIFNFSKEEFNQIVNQNSKKDIVFRNCPIDSACFQKNRQSFKSYKLFTSLTSALTLAIITIYIVTYLFVENKFVKKFK